LKLSHVVILSMIHVSYLQLFSKFFTNFEENFRNLNIFKFIHFFWFFGNLLFLILNIEIVLVTNFFLNKNLKYGEFSQIFQLQMSVKKFRLTIFDFCLNLIDILVLKHMLSFQTFRQIFLVFIKQKPQKNENF